MSICWRLNSVRVVVSICCVGDVVVTSDKVADEAATLRQRT